MLAVIGTAQLMIHAGSGHAAHVLPGLVLLYTVALVISGAVLLGAAIARPGRTDPVTG